MGVAYFKYYIVIIISLSEMNKKWKKKDKRKVFIFARDILLYSRNAVCRVQQRQRRRCDRLSCEIQSRAMDNGIIIIPRNYIEIQAIPALSSECVLQFGAAPLCIWTVGVGVIFEGEEGMKA